MADLLVNLYEMPESMEHWEKHIGDGYRVERALAPDKSAILEFVKNNFEGGVGWEGECSVALARMPVSCFVAVADRKIVGFSCYDATARGFFGPTGVDPAYRNRGIGRALLGAALKAMREEGYGYAAIGWPATDAVDFYIKSAGALPIPSKGLGVYSRLAGIEGGL